MCQTTTEEEVTEEVDRAGTGDPCTATNVTIVMNQDLPRELNIRQEMKALIEEMSRPARVPMMRAQETRKRRYKQVKTPISNHPPSQARSTGPRKMRRQSHHPITKTVRGIPQSMQPLLDLLKARAQTL